MLFLDLPCATTARNHIHLQILSSIHLKSLFIENVAAACSGTEISARVNCVTAPAAYTSNDAIYLVNEFIRMVSWEVTLDDEIMSAQCFVA